MTLNEEILQLGDVLVTRNLREEDNTSPGVWNHVALYAGDGDVIEAQAVPNMVITSGLYEFLARYPSILVLRPRCANVQMAVDEAYKLVGRPYRKIASAFRFLRRAHRGENCVSVLRKSFGVAYGFDPGWKIPDDLATDARHFDLVGD